MKGVFMLKRVVLPVVLLGLGGCAALPGGGHVASAPPAIPAAPAAMAARPVALATPAAAQIVLPAPASDNCKPDALSLDSTAGIAWLRANGWRYASQAAAAADYKALVSGASPWPMYLAPVKATLPAGTRFQMAVAPGQTNDQPGSFGTFDRVDSVSQVREGLAVRFAWKPLVDRVITYEVTAPLPVLIGPIGPQIDPYTCSLLPGRWSQFDMQVAAADRMKYLKVVDVRQIQ